MEKYLIGIDAGSTSIKVIVFDTEGRLLAKAEAPTVHLKSRGEGFEEFDLDELWNAIASCLRRSLDEAGITGDRIAGIGVTSFGNGVVFLGKDGEVIAPGCFSQDYRAKEIIAMYQREGTYDRISEIVKGRLYAGEPGPILRWYKEENREIYDKIGGILTFKDYVVYRLTNVLTTDLNCFGGSFMIDMSTMEYSRELMELYGILELFDALPALLEQPADIAGYVKREAARQTGLSEGIPVCTGMMDMLACLVGAGGTEKGVYTAVAGSWCINETHSSRIVQSVSSNMPYLYKGEYLNGSFTGASGSNYEWFIRALGEKAKSEAKQRGRSFYQVLDDLIHSVSPDEAGVYFSPFVAQPSIHVNAKANFFNIDLNTSYADLCYAVAEGVAFIHKFHVDILKEAGLPLNAIRLTGGIARSQVWSQLFADVLRIPIEGVECEETGALGAAIAAGVGAGIYSDYEDACEKAVKVKAPVMPNGSVWPVYEKRYEEWSQLNGLMKQYWDNKKNFK